MTPRHGTTGRAGETRRQPRSKRAAAGAAAVLALLAIAPPAEAQNAGKGFLFRDPRVSFGVRAGFARASAESDIFTLATDELTLDRSDFDGVSFGADLGLRLTQRLDLSVGAEYAGADVSSEVRDWVDQDDLPIEQSTSYKRVPVTASLKLYLTPRGHSIGQFAWIPNRYVPFVGVGGGAMWYRFRQEGDFVDFETLDVFNDMYTSSGWTPTGHGFAGLDISLGPRWVLTGQGKYTYAKARMNPQDFDDFDKIDLSGFSATFGLSVRF